MSSDEARILISYEDGMISRTPWKPTWEAAALSILFFRHKSEGQVDVFLEYSDGLITRIIDTKQDAVISEKATLL